MRSRCTGFVGFHDAGSDSESWRDGRIELLDMSKAPNFTLSPSYSAKMLHDSPNEALRDACTTHGVDFFTRLGDQLVMLPPMSSLADGLASVLDTLRKMVARGWFEAHGAIMVPELR